MEIKFKLVNNGLFFIYFRRIWTLVFDNNLKFMSNENDTISEEDYYLSDALAQDGESIENYAI